MRNRLRKFVNSSRWKAQSTIMLRHWTMISSTLIMIEHTINSVVNRSESFRKNLIKLSNNINEHQ